GPSARRRGGDRGEEVAAHQPINPEERGSLSTRAQRTASPAFRCDRTKEGEMVPDAIGGGGGAGRKTAECRALGHHQPRCRIDEDVLIVDSAAREGAAVVRQPPLEAIAPGR